MAAKRRKIHKMKRGSEIRPHPSDESACQRKALFFLCLLRIFVANCFFSDEF
jgi:hypothetical protein